MRLFQRSTTKTPPTAATMEGLEEVEAVKIAISAREKLDWPTALVALERVENKQQASADYHSLRDWALTAAGRKGDDSPWQRVTLEGQSLGLDPNDMLALTQLIHEVRPLLIWELGSRGGGAATWLGSLCRGLGLQTEVHSADWGLEARHSNDQVQFCAGDLRKPSIFWPGALLKKGVHPCLLLVRLQAGHDITWSALRAMHKWLGKDDVICVLNESEKDRFSPSLKKQSSAHALMRFVARHPVEYGLIPGFEASFGPDQLPSSLLCFRHTGLNPFDAKAAPELGAIIKLMQNEEWPAALADLNARKATRVAQRGVDYLRGLCFLNIGEIFSVCEAAKEELRYHPAHEHAEAMLASMMRQLFPTKPKCGGDEFHAFYAAVRPYTMLSEQRLYSLYLRTRLVCEMDVPGDMVECGVAAGGGSALIAATMAKHTRRPRKVYSCDSFEGMPAPTARDIHGSMDAEASGWGSGTCAAPPGSLLEICGKLGVEDYVVPVKGFFSATLPALKDQLLDGIAFLHMDGDWYESTMDILVSLYHKVQPQGFIQVDDYGHWEGCRQAMHDYADKQGFLFSVHAIDDTGVWLQRPDRTESQRLRLHLGSRKHCPTGWVNLDVQPTASDVTHYNLEQEPLPFENESCAAVCHSYLLEQMEPANVPAMLAECHRVLAPGGVLRIAVTDLESIAREYLNSLDSSTATGTIDTTRLRVATQKGTYDRVSLRGLLEGAGFHGFRVCTGTASLIPDLVDDQRDADSQDCIRHTDALMVEAVK